MLVCQQEGALNRRLLRRRLGGQKEKVAQNEDVTEESDDIVGFRGSRFRSRQRAMRGPLIPSTRFRPGRRPFNRRPGGRLGGRRFPGDRRRPLPAYDYYDYYYDEYYEEWV